jgi:AbrB family looped-hinge helix DNA binding protein
MIVTITSKGQITIPLSLRKKFHLNVGDQLEFDESAPCLTARRAVDRGAWDEVIGNMQKQADEALRGHPWATKSAAEILDEMRGAVEPLAPKS